ncbi:hypothetical protein Dsin_010004 [Dipteronia sinensis]|uniref:EXS domain-containing protein n=1 Tax=Dipteronia sinensis TaxID=43782 RepID=A0AAE0ASV5_9ROSI|nr:hypothetical protein Dsin_010004 [Dipteronia sinensis]
MSNSTNCAIVLAIQHLVSVKSLLLLDMLVSLHCCNSSLQAVVGTYWDLVYDWGLLNRKSKNRWLRDMLLVPEKKTYFIAIVLNILLRFAWLQSVLGCFKILHT